MSYCGKRWYRYGMSLQSDYAKYDSGAGTPCVDGEKNRRHCPFFKKSGHCHQKSVQEDCPYSCGICGKNLLSFNK